MTHDELMAKILEFDNSCNTSGSDKEVPKSSGWDCYELHSMARALRSLVELHKPVMQWSGGYDGEENPLYAEQCNDCSSNGFTQEYPCQTIQAIERELG